MIVLDSDGVIVYCQFPDIYKSNSAGIKLEKLKPSAKSTVLDVYGYMVSGFKPGDLYRIGEKLFICNVGGNAIRPQILLYEVEPVPESQESSPDPGGFEINLDDYPGLTKVLKIMAINDNRSVKDLVLSILYKEVTGSLSVIAVGTKDVIKGEYVDTII